MINIPIVWIRTINFINKRHAPFINHFVKYIFTFFISFRRYIHLRASILFSFFHIFSLMPVQLWQHRRQLTLKAHPHCGVVSFAIKLTQIIKSFDFFRQIGWIIIFCVFDKPLWSFINDVLDSLVLFFEQKFYKIGSRNLWMTPLKVTTFGSVNKKQHD